MQQLHKGVFFGNTDWKICLNGITITETNYVHSYVDWHCHELPYFTYLLQGQLLEANHRHTYECVAGDVLFHNWQNAHYNRKPDGPARGFHVEIDTAWLEEYDISLDILSGSYLLKDPEVLIRMGRLYKASLQHKAELQIGLDEALVSLLEGMGDAQKHIGRQMPVWVSRVEGFIRDGYASSLTLQILAKEGGIHPVHLCRDFSRYFGCTLTAYIRKVRIERSLTLLRDRNHSLSSIAYHCGFADQSHFIRAFRTQMGCSPGQYRQLYKG